MGWEVRGKWGSPRVNRRAEIAQFSSASFAWREPRVGNQQASRARLHPPVQAALDELTPEARAMLLLRYQEDKSHKQVGEAFGLSHEAARKRHAGLVNKLRKRLNPEDVL